MDSSNAGFFSALPPATKPAAGRGKGEGEGVEFDGTVLTVTTEGNGVAEVLEDGARRVLGTESFFDAGTGTRHHFVDVQGRTEAVLLLVSVDEDRRRIVGVRRLC